jgi:glycosyltransferase involved in cell wall biosynthesis
LFEALNHHPDVDLTVCYSEAGSPDSPWPKEELRPFESILRSFYISWRGKRFIINWQLPRIKGYDAVVINGYVTIPSQWVMRTAAGKVPLVFWGEKMEHAQGGLREFMQGILTGPMKKLSAIVAIGKKAARDYRRQFPDIRVHEVPYYCRLDGFNSGNLERPRSPATVFFCGQMIARKGVDLLLKAFQRVIESGLPAKLLLVGREADLPGMLEEIPSEVQEHIEFAGFQAPDKLPEFFEKADVFVLPSRYDGWGVVVNQALAAGLPAICSDAVGAAEDLVKPDWNGYIFPSGETDSLAEQLSALLSSPGKVKEFGDNSLKKSREITPDQGAEDWVRILEEVIGK